MTLPLLGPMSLRGFAHPWYFLFILAILALIGLYIVVQLARQKRVGFTQVDDQVAPFDAAGDTSDDLAFAVNVFVEDDLALSVADSVPAADATV